jgi:hypothetical protein
VVGTVVEVGVIVVGVPIGVNENAVVAAAVRATRLARTAERVMGFIVM